MLNLHWASTTVGLSDEFLDGIELSVFVLTDAKKLTKYCQRQKDYNALWRWYRLIQWDGRHFPRSILLMMSSWNKIHNQVMLKPYVEGP